MMRGRSSIVNGILLIMTFLVLEILYLIISDH